MKDSSNISKLQLLVRLIFTENLGVSNKIVRGTNKQNLVLEEAFEATLPFHQETLEPFFLAFENNEKIHYERRAKQYNNDPLIKKTHIVNLRILTQTFVGLFLSVPHESHRHEAKLLEQYAGDKDKRRIFRDDHSPYPYYICAMTWYMFEKYFREERIEGKYRTFKSHLCLIFRYSLGEYPPRLTKSKALDSFCENLLQLLKEPQFENQVRDVLNVFDTTYRLWIQNRSRHAIKDNKDFTDLLIGQSRERFIKSQTSTSEICEGEGKTIHQGKILRVIWNRGIWFGFIKRGWQDENVYFDSRSYRGEPRELIPNRKVKFEIGHNDIGDFARNVVFIDN